MRRTLAQIGGVSGRQIIGISKEHTAGLSVTEPCRKHRISDATFCTWRKKYDGMEVSDARKLRSLKDEKSPSEKTPGGAGSRKRDWPDAVKTSDAKFEEKGRELGQEEKWILATPGLWLSGGRPASLSLPPDPIRRQCASSAPVKTRGSIYDQQPIQNRCC